MKISTIIGLLLIVVFVSAMALLNVKHIINSTTEIFGILVGVVVLAALFGIKFPKK